MSTMHAQGPRGTLNQADEYKDLRGLIHAMMKGADWTLEQILRWKRLKHHAVKLGIPLPQVASDSSDSEDGHGAATDLESDDESVDSGDDDDNSTATIDDASSQSTGEFTNSQDAIDVASGGGGGATVAATVAAATAAATVVGGAGSGGSSSSASSPQQAVIESAPIEQDVIDEED